MAMQKQDDQHEHTFSSYVRIGDVVLMTCLRRWTIGRSGERGSGISVLPARHDDDDDIYMCTDIYIAVDIHMRLHISKSSPYGWRLMRLGYRTCFHTLYDEYIYIYIYILWQIKCLMHFYSSNWKSCCVLKIRRSASDLGVGHRNGLCLII